MFKNQIYIRILFIFVADFISSSFFLIYLNISRTNRAMIIVFPFIRRFNISGITLFPVIFLASTQIKHNEQIVNHEKIHLRQEMELLVVLFYLIYFTEFLVGYIKYNDRYKAYRNISFEREAFTNDFNPDYLKIRRPWSWYNYL